MRELESGWVAVFLVLQASNEAQRRSPAVTTCLFHVEEEEVLEHGEPSNGRMSVSVTSE